MGVGSVTGKAQLRTVDFLKAYIGCGPVHISPHSFQFSTATHVTYQAIREWGCLWTSSLMFLGLGKMGFLGKVGFWHPVILANLYSKCFRSVFGRIPASRGQGKYKCFSCINTTNKGKEIASLTPYALRPRKLWRVPTPEEGTAWFQWATAFS